MNLPQQTDNNVTTSEKAVKQLCKIIFQKAYAIGNYYDGDVQKVWKEFDKMVLDLVDNRGSEEVRELIKVLSK